RRPQGRCDQDVETQTTHDGKLLLLSGSSRKSERTAFTGRPPASTNTRTCCAESTLQPQASELPCSATGWPSTTRVLSPSTIGYAPLCRGQVAWSVTRATGVPSISVNGEPGSTLPPLLVGSPWTIQFLAIMRSLHDRRVLPAQVVPALLGRCHLLGGRVLVDEIR